jgi:hypothetical protein
VLGRPRVDVDVKRLQTLQEQGLSLRQIAGKRSSAPPWWRELGSDSKHSDSVYGVCSRTLSPEFGRSDQSLFGCEPGSTTSPISFAEPVPMRRGLTLMRPSKVLRCFDSPMKFFLMVAIFAFAAFVYPG